MARNFVVIGAGITGITTAYYLTKAGYEVTVLDSEPYPAMMTSYANGGQFSVSNSETWTTWPNVKKGARWLMTPGAPLLVRPWPSIPKIKWLTGFLWNTATGAYEKNTRDTITLGLMAREFYDKIAAEEGIEFDRSKCGILHFYKNKEYFESAVWATENIYKKMNIDRRVLTQNEVLDAEPNLARGGDIIGGTYTASDSVGDIHKFCNNLAAVLRRKYQVKFIFDAEVTHARRENSRWILNTPRRDVSASDVVICAGSNSAKIGKMFKESLPVYPVKGYSITITDDPRNLPTVSLLDDEAKIVTSTLGNRLRVAGTAELDDWNRDIRMSRIEPLVKWVRHNLTAIDTRDVKPWAGLRPMTPSMMPVVKKGELPGVYINTGHGHLGWTLGAATAHHLVYNVVGYARVNQRMR